MSDNERIEQAKTILNNMPSGTLVAKCEKWIQDLCDSGGAAWVLRVPPDPKRDPDLLFSELCRRVSIIGMVEQVIEAAQRAYMGFTPPAPVYKIGDEVIYTAQNLKAHPFHYMKVEAFGLFTSKIEGKYWLYRCVHHDPATGVDIPKLLREEEIQPRPNPVV